MSGRHSLGESGVFWRSLLLSVLKWVSILVLPVLAIFGVWKLVLDKPSASSDSGSQVDSTDPSDSTPSPSASPSSSPSAKKDVQILDGASNVAQVESLKIKLRDSGHNVVTTGNASRAYENTTVFFQEGSDGDAADLATQVGTSEVLPAPDNLDPAIPLTVVIGADLNL